MDMGKWRGLFEWSMKYQDGTTPSNYDSSSFTPERRAWLQNALSEYMKDFATRMKEIKTALDGGGGASSGGGAAPSGGSGEAVAAVTSLREQEVLLDELMEIVESIDHARDLHKVGGLSTLLDLLASPHPSLRWRAAEVAATCMANNPPVQRWFMEGGALPPLLALMDDPDPECATKALLALSALVRHYSPGLEAFRLAGGLYKLVHLLGSHEGGGGGGAEAAGGAGGEAAADGGGGGGGAPAAAQVQRLQRKALALLLYTCSKHSADCVAAAEFGAPARLAQIVEGSGSSPGLVEAALEVLVAMAVQPAAWRTVVDGVGGAHGRLAARLRTLAEEHAQLAGEEAEGRLEEVELAARLRGLLDAERAPEAAVGLPVDDHIEVADEAGGGGGSGSESRHVSALPLGGGGGSGEDAGGVGAAPAVAQPRSGGSGQLALVVTPQLDPR